MLKYFIGFLVVVLVCLIIGIIIKTQKNSKNPSYNKTTQETKTKSIKLNSGNEIDLSNVDILLKTDLGQELQFIQQNTNEISATKKYKEIGLPTVSNIGTGLAKCYLPISSHVQTAQEIAKTTKNGLFTATANPEILSKFKDGTISTMIRPKGSKGIQGNAGFKEVSLDSLSKVNPSMAVATGMQAMAMVSGQYYMDQISNELRNVNSSLDEIKDNHKDEKIGRLIESRERLLELIQHDFFDEVDFNELRSIRRMAAEIRNEYKQKYDRLYNDVLNLEPDEWISKHRFNSYREVVDNLKFPLQIAMEADKLELQARLTEISARKRRNIDDPKLTDLIRGFELAFSNSLNTQFGKEYDEIISKMFEKAEDVVVGKKIIKPTEKRKSKLLVDAFEEMQTVQNIMTQNFDKNLYQKALCEDKQEQEILLLPGDDDNPQRMFIAVD